MFVYDTWHPIFVGVMVKLAADPGTVLGEREAKAVPPRRFTDDGGYTAWDGEPFPRLDAWADDDPAAAQIARSALIAEAQRMLREITDPALTPVWRGLYAGTDQNIAATAVRALIRYLHQNPT